MCDKFSLFKLLKSFYNIHIIYEKQVKCLENEITHKFNLVKFCFKWHETSKNLNKSWQKSMSIRRLAGRLWSWLNQTLKTTCRRSHNIISSSWELWMSNSSHRRGFKSLACHEKLFQFKFSLSGVKIIENSRFILCLYIFFFADSLCF